MTRNVEFTLYSVGMCVGMCVQCVGEKKEEEWHEMRGKKEGCENASLHL